MSDDDIQLLRGERLMWSGRPGRGLIFTAQDVFLIPFSVLWCGFVVFWETMTIVLHAPVLFRIWGIPFLVMGFYLLAGRFLIDACVRARTTYFVTNYRILIRRSWPFNALIAVSLNHLPVALVSESGNGWGTIRFGENPSLSTGRFAWSSWTPALDGTPQLQNIEDVRDVFYLIQRLSTAAA